MVMSCYSGFRCTEVRNSSLAKNKGAGIFSKEEHRLYHLSWECVSMFSKEEQRMFVAAIVLQGLLQAAWATSVNATECVAMSVEHADALLAELERKTP